MKYTLLESSSFRFSSESELLLFTESLSGLNNTEAKLIPDELLIEVTGTCPVANCEQVRYYKYSLKPLKRTNSVFPLGLKALKWFLILGIYSFLIVESAYFFPRAFEPFIHSLPKQR